jgi:hypothetical protein
MVTKPNKLEDVIANQTKLISDFISATQGLVEADHKKVDFVYEFLFIGKPDANPPVPPFIVSMQKNTDDISEFKGALSKLVWAIVGLIITGISLFTVTVYNHVYLISK